MNMLDSEHFEINEFWTNQGTEMLPKESQKGPALGHLLSTLPSHRHVSLR
jgi:hypothetical protein